MTQAESVTQAEIVEALIRIRDRTEGLADRAALAEAANLLDETGELCPRCGWELGSKDGCPGCYPPHGDPAGPGG